MAPRVFLLLLLLLAACSRPSPVADLAARLPANAAVLAGADLDRLRSTPLFPHLPQYFREGSYVLAAFTGADLVTATRGGGRVTVSGPAGEGAPDDLLKRVPDAPVWLVARGSATLPLTGNLANLNRLLHQAEYIVVSARPGDRVEIRAEASCRGDGEAQRLEENVRALGSLTHFPLEVVREGVNVRVTATVSPDALGKVL